MSKKTLFLGLALSAGLLATGVSAAAISGKSDLTCATIDVVGCTSSACTRGQATTFDLPTFMFVDVERRVVYAENESGEEVVSPIKNFEVTENAIVLQGLEDHRGWTAGIDRKSGGLTLSSTGADVSFIIFGNCTER
ncbi:MAG: hypothetical protein V7700_09250 [Halioglobus sp.]